MSTEVALRDPTIGEIDFRPPKLPSDGEIDLLFRVAKGLAISGIYKDARQAEQAFAKLLIGHELGLGIAQSMQGLQFVEGQIQVHYSTLAYFVKSRGFDYRFLRLDDEGVEIQFVGRNGEPLDMPTSVYTMEDAATAGKAGKDTYKRHPRNMLIARAMSNGVKWFLPEAMAGVPVYVEGEVIPDAEVSEGEGSGDPAGIQLPSSVEEVIARAEKFDHSWAYRPAWEMKVDRKDFDIEAEVAKANADLDAIEERATAQADSSDIPIAAGGLSEPGEANAGEPTIDEQMAEAPAGTSAPEHASVLEATVATAVQTQSLGDGEKEKEGSGRTGEGDRPSPVAQEVPKTAPRRGAGGREGERGPSGTASTGVAQSPTATEKSKPKPKRNGSDDIEVLRARRRLYENLEASTEEEQREKAAELSELDKRIEALGQKEAAENPEQQTLI